MDTVDIDQCENVSINLHSVKANVGITNCTSNLFFCYYYLCMCVLCWRSGTPFLKKCLLLLLFFCGAFGVLIFVVFVGNSLCMLRGCACVSGALVTCKKKKKNCVVFYYVLDCTITCLQGCGTYMIGESTNCTLRFTNLGKKKKKSHFCLLSFFCVCVVRVCGVCVVCW